MITIIHGTDVISSRRRFIEEKQKVAGSQIFDGEKLILTEIIQHVEGSLFGGNGKLFIENLFSRKKSKELDGIVSYLQLFGDEVFLWENDDCSKKIPSLFPKAKVLTFKLPQTLFAFLDVIGPSAGKKLVLLFHQTLKTTEAEFVFYMIIRQTRILLALSSPSHNNGVIDELARLAPWQRGKLQSQSRLFSPERLKEIYKRLYEIDLAQKTGNTSLSLIQQVDFFLLDL